MSHWIHKTESFALGHQNKALLRVLNLWATGQSWYADDPYIKHDLIWKTSLQKKKKHSEIASKFDY